MKENGTWQWRNLERFFKVELVLLVLRGLIEHVKERSQERNEMKGDD